MKALAKISIFLGVGILAYFLFFRKTKKDQLKEILVDSTSNSIKTQLTEEEQELLKELLLNIQDRSELEEYTTAFEELVNNKDADLMLVVETLLPESAQIAILADWSEKGIINIDALSESEKESGKMNASFSSKQVARVDVKNVTQSDLDTLTRCYKIYAKAIDQDFEKFKVTKIEVVEELDPYWLESDIEYFMNQADKYRVIFDDSNLKPGTLPDGEFLVTRISYYL